MTNEARLPLLSPKELAKELGVHPESVKRAYRNREIPAFRLGKVLRFDLDQVQRVMFKNAQQQPGMAQLPGAPGAVKAAGAGRPRPGNTGAQITRRSSRRS